MLPLPTNNNISKSASTVFDNKKSRLALSGTKETRTVKEALLQQSLAGNKCYRAGERITELDCQGEEGRAGNNRQGKNQKCIEKSVLGWQSRISPIA